MWGTAAYATKAAEATIGRSPHDDSPIVCLMHAPIVEGDGAAPEVVGWDASEG